MYRENLLRQPQKKRSSAVVGFSHINKFILDRCVDTKGKPKKLKSRLEYLISII